LETLILLKPVSKVLALERIVKAPKKPGGHGAERRHRTMTHPTQAGLGLVRLGESSFVPANLEDDVRGMDVYDPEGRRVGSVEDLYIDRQEREVRFLEVGSGGILGIGRKRFLVPVEEVVEVTEEWVAIEPGRTERMQGPAPLRQRR
jgi:sporulation protein YlmC with PRC-barrel domain